MPSSTLDSWMVLSCVHCLSPDFLTPPYTPWAPGAPAAASLADVKTLGRGARSIVRRDAGASGPVCSGPLAPASR